MIDIGWVSPGHDAQQAVLAYPVLGHLPDSKVWRPWLRGVVANLARDWERRLCRPRSGDRGTLMHSFVEG